MCTHIFQNVQTPSPLSAYLMDAPLSWTCNKSSNLPDNVLDVTTCRGFYPESVGPVYEFEPISTQVYLLGPKKVEESQNAE